MELKSDSADLVRTSAVVEYQSFVTGTPAQLGLARDLFQRLGNEFYAECSKLGVNIHFPTGVLRPMTRDEAVQLVPRKWHFRSGENWLCSTEHVSLKNVTDERDLVTCKLCLKEMKKNEGS